VNLLFDFSTKFSVYFYKLNNSKITHPLEHFRQVSEELLASEASKVQLAGLGVRDSLRVEAGLCLYGAELTEEISPIEAGLAWLVSKKRREEADFPGYASILQQIRLGPKFNCFCNF